MKKASVSHETMFPSEIGLMSAPFHCIESCAVPPPESTHFRERESQPAGAALHGGRIAYG